MIVAMCTQTSLVAQEKAVRTKQAAVSVPFVGCKSDGQSEPREAPKGTHISLPISVQAARMVASYRSPEGLTVLAPRGWYCLGLFGSGGDSLYVAPQPIDESRIGQSGFAGPIIEILHRFGNTSGRSDVAAIIARVFPAYKNFASQVMEEGLGGPFKFGPYPKDALTYRNNRMVEYRTPAQTEGLGTYWLKKNGSPIDGVAMLVGPAPDVELLSVRLTPELVGLTSVIVQQFERDAQRSDLK